MGTSRSLPNHIGSEKGSSEGDCAPWIPATHPDGALYFFDKGRVRALSPLLYSVVTNPLLKRLFTDTDMQDPELREEMEEFYHYLQKIIHYDGLVIPSNNYDLVLDIMPTEDGRMQWSYYYACHETRCLFWLDVYEANHMISEVFCVTSPAHVSELQISSFNFVTIPADLMCAEHRLEAL